VNNEYPLFLVWFKYINNRYKDEDEMKEYLNIAFSKAERLKLLIEDLFEYTKLNNKGITWRENMGWINRR